MKRFKRLIHRFLRAIPRASLNWLSISDVKRVRDSITMLSLGPGEHIEIAPPPGHFGVSKVSVSGSMFPCFTWSMHGLKEDKDYTAWLKVSERGIHLDVINGDPTRADIPVEQLPLSSPQIAVVGDLIKALSHYFPFLPSADIAKNGRAFS